MYLLEPCIHLALNLRFFKFLIEFQGLSDRKHVIYVVYS
jgi:hypothetical protein